MSSESREWRSCIEQPSWRNGRDQSQRLFPELGVCCELEQTNDQFLEGVVAQKPLLFPLLVPIIVAVRRWADVVWSKVEMP